MKKRLIFVVELCEENEKKAWESKDILENVVRYSHDLGKVLRTTSVLEDYEDIGTTGMESIENMKDRS